MRIVGGELRGRTFAAPKGRDTRPTTERVRESEMSMLASARGGFGRAVVLDAFAGSGALGLEALSRGAASAVFYDSSPAAARVLRDNVRTLGLSPSRALVRRADVLAAPPLATRPPFDVAFLDPPYALEAQSVLGMAGRLARAGALAPQALVLYEHDAQACEQVDEAAKACGFSLAKRKKYGDTVLDMLKVGLGPT